MFVSFANDMGAEWQRDPAIVPTKHVHRPPPGRAGKVCARNAGRFDIVRMLFNEGV